MKKNYRSGFVAVLTLSIATMVGCSADPVERTEITTPTRVTPKIIITTEDASDSVAKAPAQNLARSEEAPSEDSCQTDSDCLPLPVPPESCIPCYGVDGDVKAANKNYAKSVMAPHKDTCMAKFEEVKKGGGRQEQPRSENCKLNGVKCENNVCVLANVARQGQPEGAAPREESGGYAGGNAPSASIPVGAGNNYGAFPGASQWGNQPGANFGGAPMGNWRSPSGSDWGRAANRDQWGSAFGNDFGRGLSYPQGYGQRNTYPGLTSDFRGPNQYGNSPYGAGFPGAGRNLGAGFPGAGNLGAGFPGADRNFGGFPGRNQLGGFPGAPSGFGNFPDARGANNYRGLTDAFPGLTNQQGFQNLPGQGYPGLNSGATYRHGYPGMSPR